MERDSLLKKARKKDLESVDDWVNLLIKAYEEKYGEINNKK
jgi:hypothetical protein|tara:strand:- start:197 stop:319 length:123 start_codon:yes stop_codon:yes gene_type:complete